MSEPGLCPGFGPRCCQPILSAALLLACCVACTPSDNPAPTSNSERVSIPFADRGGIQNFKVIEDNVLLLEGRGKKWYRVTLFGSCQGLRFAQAIGYKTSPMGDFDDTSSIIVEDQVCRVRTIENWVEPEPELEEGSIAVE